MDPNLKTVPRNAFSAGAAASVALKPMRNPVSPHNPNKARANRTSARPSNRARVHSNRSSSDNLVRADQARHKKVARAGNRRNNQRKARARNQISVPPAGGPGAMRNKLLAGNRTALATLPAGMGSPP